MDNENLIFEGKLLEVASYKNYREATFLISVLDEPDAYGRIIPKDVGEKYAKTIIGYPVVAKLKKNIFGQPSDFGGHEVYEVKLKNGRKKKQFGTTPIGSVLNAWVEERELDDFDEPKECILCSTKLWSGRFPEYFKVLDKLWETGKVCSSWELTATKAEKKDGFTIFKVIEFIGTCILGSTRIPAVKQGGIIEYAEFDDYETELANALEMDISNAEIADLEIDTKKEDKDLANEKVNEILDTPIEDTAEKVKKNVVDSKVDNPTSTDNIDEEEDEKDKKDKKKNEENAECKTKKKTKTTKTAEKESEPEVAALTNNELFRAISKKCKVACDCEWGYITYWFPEERTVWYKPCNLEGELDYKLFTYEVENDEVTVSEPKDVKLTVSIMDVNTEIASKDEKIATLTAELEIKNEAVISAGEKIGKLNLEISELKPYKEKVEIAEREKIEAEIAEEKESLRANMLKGGLFSEEEISKSEIAELIEARDKSAINSLIAEKYIASFDKESTEVNSETKIMPETATASLEVEDVVDENPSNFMKAFLLRK